MKINTIESEVSFMEPILNSGDPKWLFVSTQEISSALPNKNAKDSIEDSLPPETKFIFETKEEGMWKCRKCGAILISKPKQPLECFEEQGGCGRATTSFDPVTTIINQDLWKLPKWEDIPREDLSMIEVFDDLIDLIKRCIVFPEEMHYKIFTLWIISSWKVECWEAIAFLIFRGLISSGKTRALDLIRELGYRMMHASGVTFPAMVRASHYHGAGVLIDEIDNKIDKRTEGGRAMIDFLKPSYRKGSKYHVADKEDQTKIISYDNYGFKAFAGEKGGYDDAMFSRAIDFQMEQDYPDVTNLRYVQDELDTLQTKLLNYRFKFGDPSDLGETFQLKGRTREIFEPIIATCIHIGVEHDDILAYATALEAEKAEDIRSTDEWVIINAINNYSNSSNKNQTLSEIDAPEYMPFSEICSAIGWDGESDNLRKKRQKLGYIFKKKLMLRTKRMTEGTVVLLNDPKNIRKLKSLYRRYKI